ncbi:MAG: hypothetical protein U0X58_00755 [Flavobacteriaceae bacterium]
MAAHGKVSTIFVLYTPVKSKTTERIQPFSAGGRCHTFDSFGAIVTNVPYCGVNISKIGQVNDPFATSLFSQFNKLNYQTNLFYGGFSSWQNIEEFSKYQGVQRFFSEPMPVVTANRVLGCRG